MVEVPRPEGYSVAPTSAPVYQQANPPGLAFGEGFAEELSKISDTVTKHAVYMQQMDNKAATDEATTAYLKKLGEQKADYYTHFGKDAADAYGPAVDNLEQSRNDIRATLGNRQQQMMFDSETRRMQDYTVMDMASHAASERKKYLVDTSEGKIQELQNSMNPYDDKSFATIDEGIRGEVAHQGALFGKPEEFVRAAQDKRSSELWKQRIYTIGLDSPRDALQMFRENSDKLTSADQALLSRALHHTADTLAVQDAKTTIMNGYNGTIDRDTLFDKGLIPQESGGIVGIQGPDTKTGPSLGLTQLQLGTAQDMARKVGLPWDPKLLTGKGPQAEAYQYVLGKAYFNEQMDNYPNPAVGLAAYNAGPGRVNDWLKRFGDPSKGEISTADWINKIPFTETKDYVTKVLARVGGVPAGTPSTEEDPRAHLEDRLAQAAKAFPDDPVKVSMLQNAIRADTAKIVSAQRAVRAQAFDNLQTTIDGGILGKEKRPTSIEELLSTDQAKQDFTTLDAKARKTVFHELAVNAQGVQPKITPEGLVRYRDLLGMSHDDPTKFIEKDLSHEALLPMSYRKSLMKLQKDIPARAMGAVNSHVQHALSIANEIPGIPQRDKGKATEETNVFTGRLIEELQTFAKVHNRAPSDPDIRKIVTGMLAPAPKTGIWPFRGGGEAEYAREITGVPHADKTAIVGKLRARLNRSPTDEEILSIWNAVKRNESKPIFEAHF